MPLDLTPERWTLQLRLYGISRTLCALFDASESSGYRTVKRNELVGGHVRSRHLDGLAVDLVLDDPSAERAEMLAAAARALGAYALVEADHVHVQVVAPRPTPPPNMIV